MNNEYYASLIDHVYHRLENFYIYLYFNLDFINIYFFGNKKCD